MMPVERTKRMTSTWDYILSHGCVHWASRLTKWIALVSVSSLWSFSGQFLTAVATSLLTLPPLPPTCPPPQYAGPKLVRTFKKRPEMA